MKNITFLVVFLLLASSSTYAQSPDRKWGVGLKMGSERFSGTLDQGFETFKNSNHINGFTLSRRLGQHIDLSLSALKRTCCDHFFDHLRINDNVLTKNNTLLNLNLKYHFFNYDEVLVRPFVFAGIGYIVQEATPYEDAVDDVLNQFQYPDLGLGIAIKVSPRFNVVFDETLLFIDYEQKSRQSTDMFLQHAVGVSLNFGPIKDTDNDGVSDRMDFCPTEFGLKEFEGCPDSDGDGIQDSKDQCPNMIGLSELKGCPDTDKDGIADNEDDCPNSKGEKTLKGCPDTDKDGVADNKDECPNSKGEKTLKGCPDTDKDGIAVKNDQCPNEKGIKKLNGCPEKDFLKEEKVGQSLKSKEVYYTLYFKTSKSTIQKIHLKDLSDIVITLKNKPNSKLEIMGHADSDGEEDMNMNLSIERARTVYHYLIKNGISKDRLSTKGFGENKPIADNKSKEGKAKNRRVELLLN